MTSLPKSCVGAAVPFLFLLGAAPCAQGQVFQYYVEGNHASGFGNSVSRVGDVDQDGSEDFIVGAPNDNNNSRGAAVVFSGQTGAEIVRLKGPSDYSYFGTAVDGRIDLDGDGYPDVLVGAPGDDSVLAYSPHLLAKIYTVSGPVGSGFGSAVRALEADLDGDGVPDFIVGAPTTNSAYVISGMTGTVLYSKTGQSGSNFGWAVSRAGDLDGDHVCDFLVGSPFYADPMLGVIGRVAAFSGATGKKLWSIDGTGANSRFGWALAQPGDLDGDGVADFVVGAPFDVDSSNVATGSVTVVSGATGAALYKVTGDANGDWFGWDVRGVAGDIDGDGTRDFIVGAPEGLASTGYARTISGAAGVVLHTYVEQTDDPSGFEYDYGSAVAGGDFNGDGLTDVLIGNDYFNYSQGLIEVVDTAFASWRNYGSGWPGTLGVPSLTAANDPVIGQPLGVTIANSAGVATPCLLLLGLSDASIPTGKGGTLLVDSIFWLPLSLPTSALTLTATLPNDPALAGVDVDLQALELDAGASKGISFTAGLDLFLGFH